MSLNSITLIGNLGKDPETVTFDGGGSVTKFPLATSETYKNKQGEKVTETEWHNVCAFGKVGETLAKYLSKGKQVYIRGKVKTRKWQDKDGNDRYTTEVICLDFVFLNNKGSDGSSQNVNDMEVVDAEELNPEDHADLLF